MMVSTVEAKKGNDLTNSIKINYNYNNAVNFIERGIEFYVFTNGEFDFNSHINDSYYNERRARNNNLRIERDFRGRIRTIGSVFINYDLRGNVSRIGNIFMRYNSGRLTRVGNLNVRYNRGGYANFSGYVRDNFYYDNGIRINLNIGDVCNYNDTYFSHRDFRRNYSQVREDNNFYYYRANTNAKIGKRSKILRRRKQVALNSKRSYTNSRNNSSYRTSNSVNSNRNTKLGKRIGNDSKRKITPERRSNNSVVRKSATKNTKRRIATEKRRGNNSYRSANKTNRNESIKKVDKKKKRVITNKRRS